VGWAWALYKASKDFSTEADAQAAMDEGATPAVLGVAADGTTPRIYVVDDHHTLSALDFSGFSDVTVTVEITCDVRDTMGWAEMWKFLGEQGARRSHSGVARRTSGGVPVDDGVVDGDGLLDGVTDDEPVPDGVGGTHTAPRSATSSRRSVPPVPYALDAPAYAPVPGANTVTTRTHTAALAPAASLAGKPTENASNALATPTPRVARSVHAVAAAAAATVAPAA
jgi:hypothetical protein